MNRAEFIKQLGLGTLAVCAGCSVTSCGTNEPEPKVNFTLDLSKTENASLAAAFNRACTHQGTPINYQTAKKNFKCPNHGSEFDLTGKAITGPATVALRSYTTELTVVNTTKQLKITN
jgi:cytochrome b6-f complex iron-sulfur subunit